MNTIVAVFLGGGLGSLARYGVSKFTLHYFSSNFPLGTLFSNLISCFILAVLVAVYGHKLIEDSMWRLFLLVGFCGGFSTFSTFGFETFILLKSANYWLAALNVIISIFAALFIMYLIIRNS